MKIGLTLSGGGMRGMAHIGILKALEEFHQKPQIISGSSMGAIVGAFYAYGYTPDQILEIALSGHYFDGSNLSLNTLGIFKTDMMLKMFRKHIPVDDFAHLKIPLYVCVTELTQGHIEYFHEGKLHQKLLASASIPYIFPPVRLGSKLYTDGGVLNNFPIEAIADKCEFLIGAHVNSIYFSELKNLSARSFFIRIMNLALAKSVDQKADRCDLFIEPENMSKFSLFNKKEIKKVFDYGYEETKKILIEKGYKTSSNIG